MISKDKFYRNEYNKFEKEDREKFLLSIVELYPEFSFLRFEEFERFGMRINTAIYSYFGVEFVFVPGDIVILGWDSLIDGMNKESFDDISESLEEYDIDDVDSFLQKSMSPLRRVKISPMLVERNPNEIGWRIIANNSKELLAYQTEIDDFIKEPHHCLTFHKRLRITKQENELIFQIYEPINYESLLNNAALEGFSLPTEDEWEYLCGGGSRTLFRWGDSFDYDMKLRHFVSSENEAIPYSLELPNQFGLKIAYDPYKYEVVNSECFLKGGDGGGNLCGGSGMILGYLPVATYFRSEYVIEDPLDYKSDIGGDYTIYRRLKRLIK